ncbi:unnamed protein product [Penicillium olsonii]|nr:unnamed protein product [Penicillium olsonii]CAG7933277.1 unnamed protein product [Penicillium olsonii]
MSRPVSLQEAQKSLLSFGSTREREFYKYLPQPAYPLPHYNRDTSSAEHRARSTSDASLSAFAQLGVLRLDAQRSTISLFGRHEEHILTEATRTLSLRDDSDHETPDELWVGACTMSYERSLCAAIASMSSSTNNSSCPVYMIPDLTQSDDHENHPDVTSYPHVRFFASAPIVSPKGIVIGAFTILDDKPRPLLDPGHQKLLTDMAATIMDYLIMNRSRSQHQRSERMIIGLGSFLEGKGSLRSSWVDSDESGENIVSNDTIEGRVNAKQQDKQRLENAAPGKKSNGRHGDLPFRPGRPISSPKLKASDSRERQGSVPRPRTKIARPMGDHSKPQNPGFTSSGKGAAGKAPSNKEVTSSQIEETFSRAANIVRESLEVEGVIFFDANFRGQAALVTSNMSDGESSLDDSSSETELKAKKALAQTEIPQPMSEDTGKATKNPCQILGFATSDASSINWEATGDHKIALSESFLAGLLRRYPSGKIFNFDADGSMSSDETSDSIFKSFAAKRYKKTRKSALRQDASTLLNIAPGSRSIIFSPVWDSHKSRWFAGSFAWTKTPQRVFTLDDEMTFCSAFGSCLIAEVHRLGALFAEQAKSDLLAGLSHELRSPLHGIFGTAELLSDTAIDALQRGFVHTIASCANTLLGSINQLLEFSGINDDNHNRGTRAPLDRQNSSTSQFGPESSVQVDAIVEDTIGAIFAGFCFFHSSRLPLRGGSRTHAGLPGRVDVILDIEESSTWTFNTRPGALHIILTNIVGNSLKYTQEGYILIQVKTTPTTSDEDGTPVRSALTISVQDTGCGMDPEFLRDGFFTPFKQENALLPGNGLGMSITQKTIEFFHGDIEVDSRRGVGTHIQISLPLENAPKNVISDEGLGHNTQADELASARSLMRLKTVGILGLGPSDTDTSTSLSLQNICREWLQMEVVIVNPSESNFRHCDYYIAFHDYLDIGNLEIKAIAPGPESRISSPVIVVCPSPRVAHSLLLAAQQRGDLEVLEFISQPCGPRKLAIALEACAKRQDTRMSRSNTPLSSAVSSVDMPKRQISSTSASTQGPSGSPGLRYPSTMKSISSGHTKVSGKYRPPLADEDYFSLVAPALAPSPEPGRSPEPQSMDQFPPTPRGSFTVLLVDDNHINVSLLAAYMKKLGLDYLTAHNGQEALDTFKESYSTIRVILMDISMPVMDGLESSRQIRAFEMSLKSQNHVPIIALTGVAQAEVRRDAIGSGMNMFLTKPVRLNQIATVIGDHTGMILTPGSVG